MRGQPVRGRHNTAQMARNRQKATKSRALVGKTFYDQGQEGRVVDVDYKTGEALVRFKGSRIDKTYHPDRIQELIDQAAAT